MKVLKQSLGKPYPLGATYDGHGVNFALFSANAEKVILCLFDASGRKETHRVELYGNDAGIWHVYLEGIQVGQLYGYRVDGPYDPLRGKRFNVNKLLTDPYAKKLTGELIWHKALFGYDIDSSDQDLSFSHLDSAPYVPKCEVTEDTFDWEDDIKPQIPFEKTIIYEMHTKGYTALFPKVKDIYKGKFEALASREIKTYLKWLGVTAVELMPVHAFFGHIKGRDRVNFWGYETLSYFALENSYLSDDNIDSFKNMVKSFHQNGQEVILDVVYNHTIEGNHLGPTLCYRGIDNESYYVLDKDNKRFYYDSTGCGASFNVDNVNVLTLVMDSLRYFAQNMHVDGFRFDLAATLGREKTEFNYNSAFFKAVRQDDVLKNVKLIVEPWDVGHNGYQIGAFFPSFGEWNDRFRDVVRRFWRGDARQVGELASRVAGSSDIFGYHNRNLWTSINFITAHDGFSLRDLVSFAKKHNEANGENNQDGTNENWSSNGGAEGLDVSGEIRQKRLKHAQNLIATLLLSFGTPMITAGDEFLKTQFGNNNPYGQDNVLSYIAWDAIEPEGYEFARFVRTLIKIRQSLPCFERKNYFKGQKVAGTHYKDLAWYNEKGVEFTASDWQDVLRQSVSYMVFDGKDLLYVIMNAAKKEVRWQLPTCKKMKYWKVLLDTSNVLQNVKFESGKVVNIPPETIIAIKITRDKK